MKYKVGDKFIIEVKEVIESEKGTLYRADFSTLVFDDFGLDKLQKCEEETITLEEFSYNKGLNDAWELARRIYEFTCDELEEIFGVKYGFHDLISKYTPQEALAKLKAYEDSKIEVGDVVQFEKQFGVVTKCGDMFLAGVREDGIMFSWHKKDCKNTGKHIDITSILEQISEV